MCSFLLSGHVSFPQASSAISHRNLTPRLAASDKALYQIPAEFHLHPHLHKATKKKHEWGSHSMKKINLKPVKCGGSLESQCFDPVLRVTCIVTQDTLNFLSPHSHFQFCVDILSLFFPFNFTVCMWTETKMEEKPVLKVWQWTCPLHCPYPNRVENSSVTHRDTKEVKYFLKLLPRIRLKCDKNTSLKYKDCN